MTNANLTGSLVRLAAVQPDEFVEMYARWDANLDFYRLMDWEPARQRSKRALRNWVEENLAERLAYTFAIRRLEDDAMIGEIGLDEVDFTHGSADISIGIDQPEFQGKGYGADAMRILLRYAFSELNLHRISLTVFSHNERAAHMYQKLGFRLEGRERGSVKYANQRHDDLHMGILREEWHDD